MMNACGLEAGDVERETGYGTMEENMKAKTEVAGEDPVGVPQIFSIIGGAHASQLDNDTDTIA